jgi:hypothetical protein
MISTLAKRACYRYLPVRVIIAIMLTLVAASGAHVTRALACDGGAEPCCCCAGPEEDHPFDPEQRIAPICGCNVEPTPEHLPPPLQNAVTSASSRMAPEPLVACVTLAAPPGPDRQHAIDARPLPKPPRPARSLLAQKTSLLV